jgi:hypothetical protein
MKLSIRDLLLVTMILVQVLWLTGCIYVPANPQVEHAYLLGKWEEEGREEKITIEFVDSGLLRVFDSGGKLAQEFTFPKQHSYVSVFLNADRPGYSVHFPVFVEPGDDHDHLIISDALFILRSLPVDSTTPSPADEKDATLSRLEKKVTFRRVGTEK